MTKNTQKTSLKATACYIRVPITPIFSSNKFVNPLWTIQRNCQHLLGLFFRQYYPSTHPLKLSLIYFFTCEIPSVSFRFLESINYWHIIWLRKLFLTNRNLGNFLDLMRWPRQCFFWVCETGIYVWKFSIKSRFLCRKSFTYLILQSLVDLLLQKPFSY